MNLSLCAVVLAAGKGTRMKSRSPKVLQPLAKRPMLSYVLDTLSHCKTTQTHCVIGYGAEEVKQTFVDFDQQSGNRWIFQAEQLGTGHAVKLGSEGIDDESVTLILYGDVPLITPDTLLDMANQIDANHPLVLLTQTLTNPTGYGRIIRDHHHRITAIVEEKDASPDQRSITEINTGFMAVYTKQLKQWLNQLNNDNAQQEYYLTDIVNMAVNDGFSIRSSHPESDMEVAGVNDRRQLARLERDYQSKLADDLLAQGVTLSDPSRLDIRGQLTVEDGVHIDANVIFEGDCYLGQHVTIEAHCVLINAHIAEHTIIRSFSHVEGAQVASHCVIGPYARLRPETQIADNCRIGNFVEIKKSTLNQGSKVNHLSYIGDTQMGADVNIGAGTITCNYDGVNKHQTIIGDNVFVGSDSQLVAPVTLGKGSVIGAGSTITKSTPEHQLTLSRNKQMSITNWVKPKKS